jgi:hypothetical protein
MSSHDEGETCQQCRVLHYDGPAHECKEERCGNCGKPKAEHHVVNFADGPLVSGETLVCPSAIWSPVKVDVCRRGPDWCPEFGITNELEAKR